MEKENVYDINDYSDAELYEILDLNNPSDRELEAKLLMTIHKYQDVSNKSGKKLTAFFESVYDRFFEEESEEEEEEDTLKEGLITLEEAKKKYQLREDKKGTIDKIEESNVTTGVKTGNVETVDDKIKKEDSDVLYTSELPYTKGIVNPILKQTTKRIISIDSQYRTTKNLLSTEFTFNLSEPLKDVVSLRLYSVQIPFTWYTIGKSFGSNFFIFKGRTSGITDTSHEIKMEIEAGNYSPQGLIDDVNTAIQTKNNSIDADISSTALTYSSKTSLSSFNIDINKQYSETSYYLQFDNWSPPFETPDDLSRNQTIASYLGFITQKNYINVLRTPYWNRLELSDATEFYLTSENNTIQIIQYYNSFPYSSSSTVDVSLSIPFSLSTDAFYSRTALIENMNTQLTTNTNLMESYVKQTSFDLSNNEAEVSLVELKVKFSRMYADSNKESRTLLILPEDANYKMWTGTNSCFNFDQSYNELNVFCSDISAVPQNTEYIIENNPKVELNCIAPNFSNNPLNDLSFVIANSDSYTLDEYVSAINAGIRDCDASFNDVYSYKVLNSPDENYVFDSLTETYPTGTFAYLQDDKFNMYLDINLKYDNRHYKMDVSSNAFEAIGIGSPGLELTDLTTTYSGSRSLGSVSLNDTFLCKIIPNSVSSGNENDTEYSIFLDSTFFSTYVKFQSAVNSAFANFTDPINGTNLFAGTRLTTGPPATSTGIYDITFTIVINKTLKAVNYEVQFIQPPNVDTENGWNANLLIDTSMCLLSNVTEPFDLSFSVPTTGTTPITKSDGSQLGVINNLSDALITGTKVINLSSPTISIETGINDTITYIADEQGVTSSGGENNVVITVPNGTYTASTLVEKINTSIEGLDGIVDASMSRLSFVSKTINDVETPRYIEVKNILKRQYKAKDYNVAFYDTTSFAQCFVGTSSVQNTTWDTTVGWIMGYREFTVYDLSVFYDETTTVSTINGDTGISTNLFNYFLLCLDDFNQSRLNDGLVTITDNEESVPLPSYANRSDFFCDPVTGQKVYNNTSKLTEKQIYAVNEIANSSANNTTSIGSSVSTKSYGKGPYASDVFGLIPVKTNLTAGQTYVEFGGSLQNQERSYFGPVNISRMTAKLLTDRGNLVDLNNANWSFSLMCEQLNNIEPKK